MKTLVMLVIAEQPMNSNDIQCVASYLNLGDAVGLEESSFVPSESLPNLKEYKPFRVDPEVNEDDRPLHLDLHRAGQRHYC